MDLEETLDKTILTNVAKAIYGTKENDIAVMSEGGQANFNMSLTPGSVLKIYDGMKLKNDDTILWIGYGDGFEATCLVLLAHKRGIKIKVIGYEILVNAQLLAKRRLARVKEQFDVDLKDSIDFRVENILTVSPKKHQYTHVYTTAPVPLVCAKWAELGLLGQCHKGTGTRQLIGFSDPHFNKPSERYLLKRKGHCGGIKEQVHMCQVTLSNSNEKRSLVFAPLTQKVRKAISSAYHMDKGSNTENAYEIDDSDDDQEQPKGSTKENAYEIDDSDDSDDSDDDREQSDSEDDSDDNMILSQITHQYLKRAASQTRAANKRRR